MILDHIVKEHKASKEEAETTGKDTSNDLLGVFLNLQEHGELEVFLTMKNIKAVLLANLCVPQLPGQGCSFHSFRTNTYKLTFMESPSGIKIILVTHPRTGDLRESLKYIYNLYVEYVVKNPLYTSGIY
ncbi:hypothetical protein Pyn_17567 [Prunus yedoensis var. nudiflora]|uniref:Trafficking protein particle complex subunit n=1 Tax=Prunus yedoensis var. nudiflora TaxID=2094558 RepID=A0A314Y691_PRUYE|nr:hypothetical protein Pyn_17567 [Prunus yedoensis var. nudiflora]